MGAGRWDLMVFEAEKLTLKIMPSLCPFVLGHTWSGPWWLCKGEAVLSLLLGEDLNAIASG